MGEGTELRIELNAGVGFGMRREGVGRGPTINLYLNILSESHTYSLVSQKALSEVNALRALPVYHLFRTKS